MYQTLPKFAIHLKLIKDGHFALCMTKFSNHVGQGYLRISFADGRVLVKMENLLDHLKQHWCKYSTRNHQIEPFSPTLAVL